MDADFHSIRTFQSVTVIASYRRAKNYFSKYIIIIIMELFGDYKYEEKQNIYKYNVNRVISWKFDKKVMRVAGEHADDRTNDDVKAISFFDIKIDRFPRGIEAFFPNLKALTINSCGLKHIRKADLKGMTKLKQLTLNGNDISVLPEDLFDESPQINTISFYGNKIKFIGPDIFDSIPNLKYANFKMNANIDVCYKSHGNGISFDSLKTIVKGKHQPQEYVKEIKTFADAPVERYLNDLYIVHSLIDIPL